MRVRAYELGDWDAIARIHDAARMDELRESVGTEAFLTLEQTAANEGLFDGAVWVAEDADVVVGFVAIRGDEVTWLYVDPSRYRQGVGRTLLRHAVATGGREVEVLDGNTAALSLYRSEGFEVVETTIGRLAGNESFAATGHLLRKRDG